MNKSSEFPDMIKKDGLEQDIDEISKKDNLLYYIKKTLMIYDKISIIEIIPRTRTVYYEKATEEIIMNEIQYLTTDNFVTAAQRLQNMKIQDGVSLLIHEEPVMGCVVDRNFRSSIAVSTLKGTQRELFISTALLSSHLSPRGVFWNLVFFIVLGFIVCYKNSIPLSDFLLGMLIKFGADYGSARWDKTDIVVVEEMKKHFRVDSVGNLSRRRGSRDVLRETPIHTYGSFPNDLNKTIDLNNIGPLVENENCSF